MNSRRFFRAIRSAPSIFIMIATILLAIIFRKVWVLVLIAGAILFLLSTLIGMLSKNNTESETSLSELYKVHDKLTPTIKNISNVLMRLKQKSRSNNKYTIVSKFMEEVVSFETVIPDIVASYRKSSEFLRGKEGRINSEVNSLQNKLRTATGDSAKETYQKALDEKQRTLQEITGIKANLDECESKLHFILSSLQRIEAIIEASELKEQMSDDETADLTTNVESFAESVRDISNIMKLK